MMPTTHAAKCQRAQGPTPLDEAPCSRSRQISCLSYIQMQVWSGAVSCLRGVTAMMPRLPNARAPRKGPTPPDEVPCSRSGLSICVSGGSSSQGMPAGGDCDDTQAAKCQGAQERSHAA